MRLKYGTTVVELPSPELGNSTSSTSNDKVFKTLAQEINFKFGFGAHREHQYSFRAVHIDTLRQLLDLICETLGQPIEIDDDNDNAYEYSGIIIDPEINFVSQPIYCANTETPMRENYSFSLNILEV